MTGTTKRSSLYHKGLIVVAVMFWSLVLCTDAHAAERETTVDSGDTTWDLVSAALAMLMTPGLAFFYGGLVRRKNMLSVLMQCLMILCIVSLQWVLLGYSLSFGPDKWSIIGGLELLGLKGVGAKPNVDYASTIPHRVFMMFQMMFAVITPALIIGAFAERMRFSSFCVFTLLWATKAVNPDGADGLLHGNPVQLWIQIKTVLIVVAFSFIVGYILLKFVDVVMKLRVSENEERIGLDLTQHREGAYTVIS